VDFSARNLSIIQEDAMMNRRSMMLTSTAASLTVVGVALPAGNAIGQTAKDLVGTWTWVTVETVRPDGSRSQPFGPNPKGHIVFDANGHFAYLLTRSGRPRFASNNRDDTTPEENKAAVQGTLAYSGRYSVSDKNLIFEIEASTFPNAEGAEQKRVITSLTADELKYSNTAPTAGGAGAKAETVLKRVR
jgi:Lipocalin-like domain